MHEFINDPDSTLQDVMALMQISNETRQRDPYWYVAFGDMSDVLATWVPEFVLDIPDSEWKERG